MGFKCRLANEDDAEKWDSFLLANTPNAFNSLYNLYDWRKVLVRSYGYEPYYFIIERGNEMVGCFPLMLVKSMIFGDRLISIPFTDHGCGPYVKKNELEILNFMLEKAKKLAYKLKVKHIKINSPQNWVQDILAKASYQKRVPYCTFILNLNKPFDDICKNFRKSIRNAYRKSQKCGIQVFEGNNLNSAQIFHKLHQDNMKRLGTPPHSKEFYTAIWDIFMKKDRLQSYFAEYDGKVVSAILLFPYRDSVRWGAGVTLPQYVNLNPMYSLLWNAIMWSTEKGYNTFDMGGSRPSSGNFFFKQRWLNKDNTSGQIVDIQHQYSFLETKDKNIVDLNDSQYQRLSNAWRIWMPKIIANRVGPCIRRQIAA